MSRQQRCREPISVQSAKSATPKTKEKTEPFLRLGAFGGTYCRRAKSSQVQGDCAGKASNWTSYYCLVDRHCIISVGWHQFRQVFVYCRYLSQLFCFSQSLPTVWWGIALSLDSAPRSGANTIWTTNRNFLNITQFFLTTLSIYCEFIFAYLLATFLILIYWCNRVETISLETSNYNFYC